MSEVDHVAYQCVIDNLIDNTIVGYVYTESIPSLESFNPCGRGLSAKL